MGAPLGRHVIAAWLAPLLLACHVAAAQDHAEHAGHGAGPGDPYAMLSKGACSEPTLACARQATPAFAMDGSLWLVWSAAGTVSIARSTDLGKSFEAPIVLARRGARLDVGPDARPQVAIDSRGRMLVAFAFFKDDAWNAEIDAAVSTDGGRTFGDARPLDAGTQSQRFPSLAVVPGDRVFATWVDKRVVAPARDGHPARVANTIVYAWSDDGGAHFAPSTVLAPSSCECCRIAVATTPAGTPEVAYRAIFGKNVRDHATAVFGADGRPRTRTRVSVDDWAVDACPHHGPAVAVSADGTSHVGWFTLGRARSGLFYARSEPGGAFGPPRALGNVDAHPGRPALLAIGRRVWLAWKEFDGKEARIVLQRSDDDGNSWTAPATVAEAAGYTDHPLLVRDRDGVYLSWLTTEAGYRLIKLGDAS